MKRRMKMDWNIRAVLSGGILALVWLTGCAGEKQTEGRRLYEQYCANCHLEDGLGVGALVPPLAGADYLATQREELPCILLNGLSDTIFVNGVLYAEQMPGVESLNHIEVTNILNYIGHSWGNKLDRYTLEEVKGQLEKCRRQPGM